MNNDRNNPDGCYCLYKIEVVLEESDESLYWLEVINEAEIRKGIEVNRLIDEANQLTAIFAATDKTVKSKRNKSEI